MVQLRHTFFSVNHWRPELQLCTYPSCWMRISKRMDLNGLENMRWSLHRWHQGDDRSSQWSCGQNLWSGSWDAMDTLQHLSRGPGGEEDARGIEIWIENCPDVLTGQKLYEMFADDVVDQSSAVPTYMHSFEQTEFGTTGTLHQCFWHAGQNQCTAEWMELFEIEVKF